MGDGPKFDAKGVSKKQLQLGKGVAKFGRKLNQINQITPYGNLKYSKNGKKVTASFSDPLQKLFDTQQGTSTAAAQGAGDIVAANSGQWATGPDLGPAMDETGITKSIVDWNNQYFSPILDQQRNQLEAKLTNQGIAPGSQAWNDAINLDDRGRNDLLIKSLLEGQDTAMAASRQNMERGLAGYNAPLSAFSTLTSGSQPAGLNFVQTPQTSTPAAPDYTGAATTQYQGEMQNQKNKLGGLFDIAKAGAGWLTGI